jgi:hypothetical protein
MCRCAEPTSPHAIDRPNAVRCRIQRIERKIQVVQRSEHLSGPLIDRGRDQAPRVHIQPDARTLRN